MEKSTSFTSSQESQARVPHTCYSTQSCKEDALTQEDEDQDKKKWPRTETQQKLLHYEGEQALTQVAVGGREVFILGDIKKSSGLGPGQAALDGPAWEWSWTRRPPGVPSKPQPFCDSVTLWRCPRSHVCSVLLICVSFCSRYKEQYFCQRLSCG